MTQRTYPWISRVGALCCARRHVPRTSERGFLAARALHRSWDARTWCSRQWTLP